MPEARGAAIDRGCRRVAAFAVSSLSAVTVQPVRGKTSGAAADTAADIASDRSLGWWSWFGSADGAALPVVANHVCSKIVVPTSIVNPNSHIGDRDARLAMPVSCKARNARTTASNESPQAINRRDHRLVMWSAA
jgi:hypothetical protein